MRSPLTPTIYKVQGMISYVRENLSTDEYMLYLDLLVPEPEVAKPASKAKKKSASKPREYDSCLRCGTTKRDSSHKDQSSPDYHEFQSSKDIDFCARCKGASYVHPVHHDETLGGYHSFESSKKIVRKPIGKSPHAQSLSSAIQRVTKGKVDDDDAGKLDNQQAQAAREEFCSFIVNTENQETCGATEDDLIHDLTYSSSHEFQPGRLATQAAAGD